MCRLLSGIAIAQRAAPVTTCATQPAGDLRVSDKNVVWTEQADQIIEIQPASPAAVTCTAVGKDDPALPAQFTQRGDGDDVHAVMIFLRNVVPGPQKPIGDPDRWEHTSEDAPARAHQLLDAITRLKTPSCGRRPFPTTHAQV